VVTMYYSPAVMLYVDINGDPTMRCQQFKLKTRVSKMWGAPPGGGFCWSSGGRKLFYGVYFGRNSSWLKYCTYRLVSVLAPN
jgi:hypothetical protein